MTNSIDNIRLVGVDILFDGYDEPESVVVGIGDGNTVFDEDYPFDYRVFYYFQDNAEFERAFDNKDGEFDFTLIRETD